MPDICNRCLIQVNATTSIRAKIPEANGGIRLEAFHYPTDPVTLKAWVGDVLAEGGRIEVGDTTDRFRAFSTWHGDPVCVMHLWDLTENERRAAGLGYGRARALRAR